MGLERFVLLTGLFVLLPIAADGQVIPSSELPGRERERFVEPVPPKSKPAGPTLTLPSTVAPEAAGSVTLRIVKFQIDGSTVYGAEQLRSLHAEFVGQQVPLSVVYEVAQRITATYGAAGYVLSRAIVPPQELDPAAAVVRIEVVEGYVDRVEWPDSLDGYRNFFSDYSARITAERPTNIKTVMRYLLLAGDLPGITVGSRFQASENNERASTLIVEIEEKPFDAFARVDNLGTEPRGPWEFAATASANNWFRHHEALTATFAGAFETSELQYVGLDYSQVLNSEGLTLFGDASYSWGEPGTVPLQLLEYQSLGLFVEGGLSYPVIRSRDKNLSVSGLFFLNNSDGEMLSSPNTKDRLRGIRLAVDFDAADRRGGISQINAVLSQGINGLGSMTKGDPTASATAGRVDFTKIDATIGTVQPVVGNVSARLAAEGQYAFESLPAAEECGFGGRVFGRGLDPSEITGDRCWAVVGEVRYDLTIPNIPSAAVQFYAFADYGDVYRIKPSEGTSKTEDGSSAGLGLRLGWNERINADLFAAKPLLGRDDDDWRYFLLATARY
ncbi:ShlB/FhaC/HecB family hemolysin secretion/activation protein [Hyphomonas sp.]|uniref:ShlB/FhaC/HecB family hemolysin secretion/activation protein n=1 Tax=Alphaproteobacteria TaxID=28211 RepID=UPI00326694DB